MPRKRPSTVGPALARVLTGLAIWACSCGGNLSDSGHGPDASPASGGSTQVGSGNGGAGGDGSGGGVGGHASGGAAGSTEDGSVPARDAADAMGSGGQSGSPGRGGSGAGGSGSGGGGPADAATNRDIANADLAAQPDVAARLDGAPPFWASPFVANCTPGPVAGRLQNDGHHRANEDCMQSGCHMGGAPDAGAAFLFGGTVRRAGSLAAYPSVEVAVRTQSAFYSACSATNGNFWVVAADAGALDWDTATARVRSANGEDVMLPVPEAACSSCHSQVLLLTAP